MPRVILDPSSLDRIRTIDPRYISYNVEMTEVTGGTFWKPYTSAQIAGTEDFIPPEDPLARESLMAVFPPVDLAEPRLRALAAALGPAWVRVSGTWATTTYYDFDGHTGGKVPEGFKNVLTRDQWDSVLDFVKAVDGKLLVSFANCAGIHVDGGSWQPNQARMLMDYSRDYGVPVAAVEFTNEPNNMERTGFPHGYTAADYSRDHDICARFLKENYPDVLFVGPCGTGSLDSMMSLMAKAGWQSDRPSVAPEVDPGEFFRRIGMESTESLMAGVTMMPEIYSYHYYNGNSDRASRRGGHWLPEQALSEDYLSVAAECCRASMPLRNLYCPGAPMWVTESGDAACGGNSWASTFLDVPRFANELGTFAQLTDGVIFHNTLASSDYGLLDHSDHSPRPNYWLALLWNRLMGRTVYDTHTPTMEGVHLFAHDRRDDKPGIAYLLINNSRENATTVTLPNGGDIYLLDAEDLRSPVMRLNGHPLVLDGVAGMPNLSPVWQEPGSMFLPPCSLAFIVV